MRLPKMPDVNWTLLLAVGFVIAALIIEVAKVTRAAEATPMTQLELTLYDALIFFIGGVGLLFAGAVVSNWQTERARAPHGRSAFLRAVELYQALARFRTTIDHQVSVLEQMAA